MDIHDNNERGKVLTDVSHFCHTIIFRGTNYLQMFRFVVLMKGQSTYRCFDLYHIFVTHLHEITFPVCAVTIYGAILRDCLIWSDLGEAIYTIDSPRSPCEYIEPSLHNVWYRVIPW